MDFVTITSKAEGDYAATLIKSNAFWVGVTDALTEGSFNNYNNLAVTVNSFMKWSAGEPNNAGGLEDCAHIGPNSFNDHACYEYLNVLCERRIPKKPATSIKTSLVAEPEAAEFYYVGNSCKLTKSTLALYQILFFLAVAAVNYTTKYYTSKKWTSWSVSRSLCTQHDMDFINFDSLLESNHYLTFPAAHTWMGITDSWVEGSFWKYNGFRTVQKSLLRWGSGEPNNAGGIEDCVEVGFNDVDCNRAQPAGCMRRIPN